MASYTDEVNRIHERFQNDVKGAKTKKSLDKAYRAHKKDHKRILKRHLKEEQAAVAEAKSAL